MQIQSDPTQLEKSIDSIKRGIGALINTVHDVNARKISNDPLLPEKTVAAILGVSCSLLQHQRLTGKGVEFVKIGRAVRYRKSAVESFLNTNTRHSTSDRGGAQ